MPEITKIAVVCKKDENGFDTHGLVFRYLATDVDTGMTTTTLVLNRKEVDELGWPDEITITIEPGNVIPSGAIKAETIPAASVKLESV